MTSVLVVRGKCEEIRISPDQWAATVAETEGPQIVVGGPGTGKSEFLARRALHILEHEGVDPSRLLVLGFGRRGVADLRGRIRDRLAATVGEVDVTTFHSFAVRVLEAHGEHIGRARPPLILTGPEQTALVRELLRAEDPADWSPAMAPMLETRTFATEVTDFVLRVGEQLLTEDQLLSLVSGRHDWRGMPEFLRRYRTELAARDRIDYAGLLAETVRLLRLPGGPQLPIEYVLVDEYQDTTTSQVALVDALTAGHRNLTVAADPYQSIYSFRGAALTNVTDFPERFVTGDTPVRRIVLTTSFRTPAAVLAAAERITAGADLPGAAGPVIPAPWPGRVETRVFGEQTAETEWVASEITRLHLTQQIPLASIGVFVRSKRRFLPELSRALAQRGIAHDDSDGRLAEQPAVRFVLDAVRAATGVDGAAETERAVRRLLLGPVLVLSLGRLRDVERLRLREGVGWPAAIRRLVADGEDLACLLEDSDWADATPAVEGFWRVWSGLSLLRRVVDDPLRRNERAAWASLGQVLGRWNDRTPEGTLLEYLHLLEDEEFEARPLLSYRPPPEDRVTLTSLHQSKGLEFDVVFICDAVDGVFPDMRPRDGLLGARHLLAHVPSGAAEYAAFRLQEERRLAYTAMGRALSRVVWTATASGSADGRGMPSRFLRLIRSDDQVDKTATEQHAPITTREAEAHFRRILADPAQRPPDRLAALSGLARGPQWGLRETTHIPGVRTRGPDDGLVPDRLQLSPTQAESYEACPRRYALERRLGIADRRSPHAEFGIFIHRVLHTAEGAAAGRGEDRSTLEEAIGCLERDFPEDRFGGGVFAAAWLARGRLLLEHLYATWPRGGKLIDLERRLTLEIGGVPWTGYADRIENRQGQVAVVDYKTTRTPVTHARAADSMQLGFYLLAARADPDIASRGEPCAAELWYPAARGASLAVRSFEPDNLEELAERLERVATAITAEEWPATPNDGCRSCAVRNVCPAWPEGGESFA